MSWGRHGNDVEMVKVMAMVMAHRCRTRVPNALETFENPVGLKEDFQQIQLRQKTPGVILDIYTFTMVSYMKHVSPNGDKAPR